ncbi:Predicted solute-binding protein [Williamwhitmania taraxaci]|uniref:Predicted solute-binding protein n=2 Tax=Williamwhitmania taraxaci TaxID=1640674 RepID=A0A1G6RMS0_9BACT|nr:Predicted solute-binding protein [Williamwhitmania taraxaci]
MPQFERFFTLKNTKQVGFCYLRMANKKHPPKVYRLVLMPNIRVALPLHINTIPFVFGLQRHYIKDEIILDTMEFSDSVQQLQLNTIDVALVPIEMLSQFNSYHIVSNYCLSSQRDMQSIALALQGDISILSTIYYDPRQSVCTLLVNILAKGYWKCNPKLQPLPSNDKIHNLKIGEGILLMDSEAIDTYQKQNCLVDLCAEWKKFTGLPLVMAVWISLKPMPVAFLDKFNNALRFGTSSINQALEENILYTDFQKSKAKRQLHQGISFIFDQEKIVSMKLFQQLQANLNVPEQIQPERKPFAQVNCLTS